MNHLELETFLNKLLSSDKIRDYGPNGLQVSGCLEIKKIMTGVTASQALIDEAIQQKADAIIVHHGLFWKGDDYVVKGMKQQRLKALLTHDINLYAYHLPLDVHATLGNNAQLAKLFNLEQLQSHTVDGIDNLLWQGELNKPITLSALEKMITIKLKRTPLTVGECLTPIQKIAWCTGAAQNYLEQAISFGVDVFISGEISERTTHMARENNIVYMACGHHATERYGVKALGDYLVTQKALQVEFIDIDNPV